MDCQRVQTCIAAEEPLSEEVAGHILSCAVCASAYEEDTRLARSLYTAKESRAQRASDEGAQAWLAALPPSLTSVRARIARERGPVAWLRARPTWQRIAAVAALLVGSVLLKSRGHPTPELGLHGALFAASAVAFLWPLTRPAPRAAKALCAMLGLVMPVWFAFWVSANSPPVEPDKAFLPCLAYGLGLTFPFLLALKALDRREALGFARVWLASSAAGVAGNALLHLHCASTGLVHLLLGHALLGLCAGAILWLVSDRLASRAGWRLR